MPDPEGETQAAEETIPDTPLHAYKDDDRQDQIKGDTDALKSDNPDEMQQGRIADDDEPDIPKQ
jgi:hypothetical protein